MYFFRLRLLLMAWISRVGCESSDDGDALSDVWSFIFMTLWPPSLERSSFPGVALVEAWMFGKDSLKRLGEASLNADPGAEMPPPASDPADGSPRLRLALFFGVLRINGAPLNMPALGLVAWSPCCSGNGGNLWTMHGQQGVRAIDRTLDQR
jgi:hypothetical protein